MTGERKRENYMNSRHSIEKQIFADYYTFLPFICFISFSFLLIIEILYPSNNEIGFDIRFIRGLGILDILCLIIFSVRLIRGKYFVEKGIEADAEIVDIRIQWYLCRIKVIYFYTIENEKYKRGNVLIYPSVLPTTTQCYIKGDIITGDIIKILVDPNNVESAIIKNHFCAVSSSPDEDDSSDIDKAIADYTQAINLEPTNAPIYFRRGNAYYGKGNYDQAIADYTKAIRLEPDNTRAYYNRSLAYSAKGDCDRAIADWEAMLKIYPNNACAKENLERTRKERGY
jgi:tetratricopeptide (TPR) repeat protein